ncbi:Beta-barrel assembly machine subunit BamA [Zhouia amylolytica]|uniref:Outer membrane protein assembly complex, YaeT protein n=2 Tax=Zhouia amylolytica TaxID=376730 RepID=W2UNK8_9FLAO|nr:POTRA domain-containing protein [Zhouia amylolytica]ETN95056.1 outer membrane protein assembly complex, YaeT protein [Zhouia amylolytica AD3]MCQ0110643.1 BamA/TamA family outer membrane protein [Zhouia amylolytica]SFS63301.1 Beta-barrel assembly machine subunit BamA [Zhouia amylolytica]
MFKRYLGVLLLFGVVFFNSATAQETSLDKGKKYILGGLEVTGVKSYNEQTVVTFTGLQIGQEITVPGEEISKVITKLWNLNLFSDISFFITRVEGEKVFLELQIEELPTLSDVKITGLKKKKTDDIVKEAELKKGKKVTESFIANTKNYLLNKYKKQGYLNTKVLINTVPDTSEANAVKMIVNIDTDEKVKVKNIEFLGNEKLKDNQLKKAMKNTKEKQFGRFWKKSKFIPEDYDTDLSTLIDAYKEKGYRDARVLEDSVVYNDDHTIDIKISVEEGDRYYFGDIDFVGNAAYTDNDLSRVLGIKKGDVYNGVLLRERIADETKPDGNDITNYYQNTGYLFSRINPVEVSAQNDTIDFEIRIIEGKPAYFNNVTVTGNERTNDHVIYRNLRTRPGQLYRKENVFRTIRELGALGYFDAEQLSPNIINPDPDAGTVDIQYGVVEAGSSQIELQGGYGGGGFIGTLGLRFNNFSIKNLFNKDAYKPVPMGDGQTLALRLQASKFYQTYSFSFIEPWLGGKKPVQFSTSLSRTLQFRPTADYRDADKDQRFVITGINVGMAKRLEWPDDTFQLSHALSYQHYDIQNYAVGGLFPFSNGTSQQLAYTVALSRDNTFTNPIFPMGGSKFVISAKFSPPYSLFNGVDYANLENDPDYKLKDANGNFIDAEGNPVASVDDAAADEAKIGQEKLKWLEFYKVKFQGDWYKQLVGQLVLRTNAEFGFLGAYNQERGVVPFERFFVGGDGLGNYALDGRENVQLRGYPNNSLSNRDGSTIFNKFSMELRYPITLKQTASIYTLGFLEAGNAFDSFDEYSPFDIKRSAGLGVRIFMPAFGLLGIDFAYGFDPIYGGNTANGWETHFIIGQQF